MTESALNHLPSANQFAVASKLVAFACALACSIAGASPSISIALSLIGYAGLAYQKKWRLAAMFVAFQVLLGLLLFGITNYGWRMPVFSEFTVLLFWNLYPVFIVAWDLVSTPLGELSAFLSRRKVPTFFILGLLVVFRFFPSISAELSSVTQSMRNRGLTRATFAMRHPLAIGEYVLVPLLLLCLQVADQLSISAIARGAERNGVRESYFGKAIGVSDIVWMGLWAAAFGICLVQRVGLL